MAALNSRPGPSALVKYWCQLRDSSFEFDGRRSGNPTEQAIIWHAVNDNGVTSINTVS